ncbi:hypothetical protein BpHYR1_052726 [Brachionus plicatilis]|uniref:Uncharacterized protein n=1 Tax=Brachionus plicatilis TaxID=10195 RepID=A0A3M7SK01_BRAPC|nr:hypothetical protein BpHYR1_052726 [Brachionus plicatilis]
MIKKKLTLNGLSVTKANTSNDPSQTHVKSTLSFIDRLDLFGNTFSKIDTKRSICISFGLFIGLATSESGMEISRKYCSP